MDMGNKIKSKRDAFVSSTVETQCEVIMQILNKQMNVHIHRDINDIQNKEITSNTIYQVILASIMRYLIDTNKDLIRYTVEPTSSHVKDYSNKIRKIYSEFI